MDSVRKYLEEINLAGEARYSASRSSGPGGQNVNKVNTRVELRFDVNNSRLLSEQEKAIIRGMLKTRLTTDGELVLSSQTERSQLKNKEKVTKRFYALLNKALTPARSRIPTKPTAGSKLKRLQLKRLQSLKKTMRKPDY
jgi:ribosome-associated protein